jgi:hypothetical protein
LAALVCGRVTRAPSEELELFIQSTWKVELEDNVKATIREQKRLKQASVTSFCPANLLAEAEAARVK